MQKPKRGTDRKDHKRPGRPPREADDAPVRLYGIHAVAAALANPRRVIHRLQATPNAARKLETEIGGRGIVPEEVTPRMLDRLLGDDTVHQGAVIETELLPSPAVSDLGDERLVIVLDQITDPQNVGALIRLAAVFGAGALVMTWRNSPPLSGALAKAASGGLEHVAVSLVPNLARALDELGDQDFIRIGLAESGMEALAAGISAERTALVLGAEGRGLRQLTQEKCERLCALRTPGALHTMNVATAAAVALHILTDQRG